VDDTGKILDAIGALGVQVGGLKTDIADLKKTDKDLATEVARIGDEQKKQGREIQDLKAETLRTFESERHASQQTMEAITEHVDKSAKAFQQKAAAIDNIEALQVKQTAILERLDKVAAHPLARRVAYAIGLAILAWLGSKGLK
jgi:regulator of replication initiation timing